MTSNAITSVVIVGGGTAGWMTAAALSRFLDNGYTKITLVESDEIGTVGVGEATIPTIQNFNKLLEIDEDDFVRATKGSFKLGIEFVNWGQVGDRYFHPFGAYGVDLHGLDFHQIHRRLAGTPGVRPLSAYSLPTAAAERGRFDRNGDPASQLGRLDYAYHFDAGLYAAYLRRYSEGFGVKRVEGKVVDVALDSDSGHVTGVTLGDGQRIEGELFVDCSGFRGLLIEQALATGYEDWSHWLPCDRAVAIPTTNAGDPPPFTRATAHVAGWQWRIPLQHRTGNGHVYSSRFTDQEAATNLLLGNLAGQQLADPRHLSFTAGRRRSAWVGNVVAIGLSAGFLEPLESTSIHLIQTGISKLLALWPDRSFAAVERDQYNYLMRAAYEGVRDFVILHYHATQRNDSPFWDHVRTMDVPDSLTRRLELFRHKGRFFRYEDELFTITSWAAVLLGQRVEPDGYDPIVDALNSERLSGALNHMAEEIDRIVASMPSQAQFIAAHCRAA